MEKSFLKRNKFLMIVLLILLLVALAFIAIFGYLLLVSRRTLPSSPAVSISHPRSGDAVLLEHTAVIRAISSDPEGVSSVEFYVNGELVGSQINPDPQPDQPFTVTQAFRPTEEGAYTIFLRAVDSDGYKGESLPVVVDALPHSEPAQADAEVIAGEGDTLEGIADRFGVNPEDISEKNPDLDDALSPGTSVFVPQPGSKSPQEEDDPEDQDDPAPPVGQPQPASPSGSPGSTLTPILTPWWVNLIPPSVDPQLICKINPQACNVRTLAGEPPEAPGTPQITYNTDTCEVQVSWVDNSDDEQGFRLYRQSTGNQQMTLVAELNPLNGSGGTATYTDLPAAYGTDSFRYVVSAFNGGGVNYSSASEMVAIDCALNAQNAVGVEIGLGEMTTAESYDRLYCYISLMGAAHERFPASQDEFITPGGGPIQLSNFFGNEGVRTLLIPEGESFTIDAVCWGWQGDSLRNLGGFSRIHPPGDWNGQQFTAGPDSGAYTVTYSLGGLSGDSPAAGPVESADIPTPYGLHTAAQRRDCTRSGGCTTVEQNSLIWNYDTEGMPDGQELVGYRVYTRNQSTNETTLFHEKLPLLEQYGRFATNTSPLLGNCASPRGFYVTALTRGVYGQIESLPSELFEHDPGCQIALEVTMESLQTGDLKDGVFNSNNLEGWGFMSFLLKDANGNDWGHVAYWNSHPYSGEENLVISPPPYTSLLEENKGYGWEDFWLGINEYHEGEGYLYLYGDPNAVYGKNQNKFVLPISHEHEYLDIWILIYDHDTPPNADDQWCDIDHIEASRSTEDWLNFDEEIFRRCHRDEGEGEIRFRIRGVEYDE